MAVPRTESVRIVPLGGLGEIGLNLMVIECGQSAIVIDVGVMFSEERALGVGQFDARFALSHVSGSSPSKRSFLPTATKITLVRSRTS